MFDSFIAPLRCSACSQDAPEAEIQTYLRGVSADGAALRVGDRPTLLAAHFISETNAAILADSVRGELAGADPVEVLRHRLPG